MYHHLPTVTTTVLVTYGIVPHLLSSSYQQFTVGLPVPAFTVARTDCIMRYSATVQVQVGTLVRPYYAKQR